VKKKTIKKKVKVYKGDKSGKWIYQHCFKMTVEKEKIIIEAELDDKAFAVGDFIQQLGDVQEQKFEALWNECKEKEWIKGMDETEAKDWLFDYVFNGWEKDSSGFERSFSETLDETNMYDVKYYN
jgi:hypothetical protein